jgi:hypothetical protein
MDRALLDTFKGVLPKYPYIFIRYLLEWRTIEKSYFDGAPKMVYMEGIIDKIVNELIDKYPFNHLLKHLDQAYIDMGMANSSEDLDRYYKSLGGIRVH